MARDEQESQAAGTPEGHAAVAGEVARERRLRLGWTQQDAAGRAGVSLATWRLVETGGRTRYQALTAHRVARALGWPPEALADLLAGEADAEALLDAPTPGTTTPDVETTGPDGGVPAGFARRWGQLSADEQAMVVGFVEGLVARRDDEDVTGHP